MQGKKRNLIGRRFGALVVVRQASKASKKARRNIGWLCKCDCGQEVVVTSDWLLLGRKKACAVNGHFWSSIISKFNGLTTKYPLEHNSWQSMHERCNNPKKRNYKNYGGRGITVCERWLDFSKFMDDMGPKPTPQHTIERKEVNGNYEPWNCRWATRKEQACNTTRTVYIEYQGKRMTLVALIEELGLKRGVVYGRLKLGWPLDAALAIPVRRNRATQ